MRCGKVSIGNQWALGNDRRVLRFTNPSELFQFPKPDQGIAWWPALQPESWTPLRLPDIGRHNVGWPARSVDHLRLKDDLNVSLLPTSRSVGSELV